MNKTEILAEACGSGFPSPTSHDDARRGKRVKNYHKSISHSEHKKLHFFCKAGWNLILHFACTISIAVDVVQMEFCIL